MQDQKERADSFESSKICFFSNFPPKECGIATFTQDLCTALDKKFNPVLKSKILALNENSDFYNYNTNKVIMQINKDDIEDFIEVAKKINKSKNIKIVCIQHEFGLFGGEYGNYLIPFLETIVKPVVVTFHSVLPDPDELRKKVVKFICSKSAAVIIMAKKAVDILKNDYGVEEEKIHIVRHGIPNVPFKNSFDFKKKLRLDNKIVLSTFGLLDKGKGIEYIIKALPKLVKKYPNLLYLIIGETHPSIRKIEGEKYRNELIKLIEKLGLKKNVKFYNKYLNLQEIINYLLASDIYVHTNLDENQIVSGTLSYALGCGKAVISAPSLYSKEILSDGRGIVVEFKNPNSFSEAIDKILSDQHLKKNLERTAYSFSRHMIWSNVALRYLNIFNKVVRLRKEIVEKYPPIKLKHLKNLTDNFGCIQFSKHSLPDKDSGYTVDDNARALIVTSLHYNLFKSHISLNLSRIYLNFLEYTQNESGWFNDATHKEKVFNGNSEDAFGRAIWALGFTINKTNNLELKEKAKRLFDKASNLIESISSPRAKAFLLIGLSHYYKQHFNSKILSKIKNIADSLVELYEKQSSEDWTWFEPYLTYSNSKLPESLFLAYEITQDKKYLKIAEKTLRFLSELLIIDGRLSLIGHNGWFNRDGERTFFDQQPIDASAMVHAYLIAYLITKKKEYYDNAVLSFNWFLGKNHIKQMIYDETTGGCFDGLNHNSVNLNQGAESTIAYLLARLYLEEVQRKKI
ncbi:D-inositol-3-phosphate glycosyltransferase [subsurface metagenome]